MDTQIGGQKGKTKQISKLLSIFRSIYLKQTEGKRLAQNLFIFDDISYPLSLTNGTSFPIQLLSIIIILCAPLPFTGENKNLKLVDAPVSGGVKRASNGTLTVKIYNESIYILN